MEFKLTATIEMSKEITFEAENIEKGIEKMHELMKEQITLDGMEVTNAYYSHNPSQFVDLEECRKRIVEAKAEMVKKKLEKGDD